jgi:hypothetical protein
MELKDAAHHFCRMLQNLLAGAQWPETFSTPDGTALQKPTDW